MISSKTKETILRLQQRYPVKRSALLPALHLAQAEVGYLPLEVQREIAELFELDTAEVRSVVTFYDMFFEEPVGKHIIYACKNLSCMLRGADELLNRLCEKLRCQPHGTTEDGEFTVIASECLAACDLAPALLVDDKLVGPVQQEELDAILSAAKSNRRASAMPLEVDHG